MKRDWDLIREIMLAVEAKPDVVARPLKIEGYSRTEVAYHIKLLRDDGWLVALDASTLDGLSLQPTCLTSKGHGFAERLRSENAWSRTKSYIARKFGDVNVYQVYKVLGELASGE